MIVSVVLSRGVAESPKLYIPSWLSAGEDLQCQSFTVGLFGVSNGFLAFKIFYQLLELSSRGNVNLN